MITWGPSPATILARLREKVERRRPIMIAGAGGGLVAKLLGILPDEPNVVPEK